MVVFHKTLTLVSVTQGYGHGSTSDSSYKSVKAHISVPTANLTMTAGLSGYEIDLTVVIPRKDDSNMYHYAEYKGIRYHIQAQTASRKELHVQLLLRRM